MSDIKQNIQNGYRSNNSLSVSAHNAPKQYADKMPQYYDVETKAFYEQYGEYATDCLKARCQGTDINNFYAWKELTIRMADSSSSQSNEDIKNIMFLNGSVDYFGAGAKIETCGNVYLNISMANPVSVVETATVHRCNSVWKYLDFYGNVRSEPFVWSKPGLLATANDYQRGNLIANAYQRAYMQYSPATSWIKDNARVILGDYAYVVQGTENSIREFTDDEDSVHLMHFDLYRAESGDLSNDDMENKIADGKSFSWVVSIDGQTSMNVGGVKTLTARSSRNGEQVLSSTLYPITYIWTSSNNGVATVDHTGKVTAVAEGTAIIYATLAQNGKIKGSTTITVSQQSSNRVEFKTTIPTSIEQYNSVRLDAAYYIDNVEQDDIVTWDIDGDSNVYYAHAEGNSIEITGYAPSSVPIKVTASYNGLSTSAQITIKGY